MKRVTGIRCLCLLLIMKAACVFLSGCGLQGQNAEGKAEKEIEKKTEKEIKKETGKEGEKGAPGERTVLTVAAVYPDAAFVRQVNAFNESSATYYVEIKQYEEATTDGNQLTSFETCLTKDILSGKGPDMISFSGFADSPMVISSKLTENLYPYMEADESFHVEDYYENIMEAFEQGGELHVLPADFQINTLCGKAAELGAGRGVTEGWEMSEMLDAFRESPHSEWLMANHSKTLVLGEICSSCMDNFVDWQTGECRFNTPEFTELLEFADTCPDKLMIANDFSLQEALASGKIFLQPVILTSPWRIADWRVSFGEEKLLWTGYPVADGEKERRGGIAGICSRGFAICANGSNKDGAWEFLKFFLEPERQREMNGIPLLREASEERIEEALTPEYEVVDGIEREKVRHEIIFEGAEPIGLAAVTEEDAGIFKELIENTHRSSGRDTGLYQLIMEEAETYFEKGKDAAQVAEIIQSRAVVYVEERIGDYCK